MCYDCNKKGVTFYSDRCLNIGEDNRYMTIDEILETDIGKEVIKELADKMVKRIKQEFPEWSKFVTFV